MQDTIIILLVSVLQVILALGLINVWLVRFKKPTKYRGAGAQNMAEEFRAYGLPLWFMYMVGGAKLLIAFCLLLGFFVPVLVLPAVYLLVVLMIGAIGMHIKIKDPVIKSLPAMTMLAMALAVVLLV